MPVQDIEGPKMLPPLMGLIPNSVVPEVDTSPAPRWAVQSGIQWRSKGCGDDVEIFLTCPVEPSELPDTNDVELNEAKAFWPLAPASCLAVGISVEELRQDAREKLAACESAKIEAELWTGALTDNPHFGSEAATEVGSGFATVGAAISALENALADCGCGSQGMIHMRRGLADALHGAGILRRIDEAGGRTSPRLETAAGTIVVAGAGYPGTGPAGEAVGATEWIYATGKIKVMLGGIVDQPATQTQAFNRETNIETFSATRAALALFDPCCLLAAEVPAGDGGAGDTGDATAGNQVLGNESLTTIATSTGIMDDWDESDRAKVNPIVGQAGIDGGDGAVTAKTTRVTQAAGPTAATLTNVANSLTSGTALALNVARKGGYFYNDDTAASVFLKFGTTASATSFTVKIAPGQFYELPAPVFAGRIDVIATAATGTLRVTEV